MVERLSVLNRLAGTSRVEEGPQRELAEQRTAESTDGAEGSGETTKPGKERPLDGAPQNGKREP